MTATTHPGQVEPTTPTPNTKPSFIERLLRLHPMQGNHHLPPPSTSPTSDTIPPHLRHTPADIRTLEAFLGPIGRRHTTVSRPTGDIESQSQSQLNTEWTKPTLKHVLRTNPRKIIFLSSLLLLVVGIIVGWVIFLNHMGRLSKSKKEDGGEESGVDTLIMVGDGCFILILLTTLFLILRQALKLLSYFRPPSSPSPTSSSSPNQEGEAPWTLAALPTYVDAVGRTQRTGDVEDRWIVGECLPRYGDERGSKLLLRSRSAEVGLLRGGGRIEVVSMGGGSIGDQVLDDRTTGQGGPEGGLQVHVDGEGESDPPEGREVDDVHQHGDGEKEVSDIAKKSNEK